MYVEKGLALVREGLGDEIGMAWSDYTDFRGDMEQAHGILPLELRRNDAAKCWEDDQGPVLVDAVEYVELDDMAEADPDTILAVCLQHVRASHLPWTHRRVPAYYCGQLVLSVEIPPAQDYPTRRYHRLSL